MSNEPQRDIEKELLAYKQRRREQAGAPLELHPATRRMLQGEVARSASRPLLSSEEAAKNFVRSFVLSHQQPGFFTRHRQRLIWGGAMFAGLMLVMAVLRNDPRQQEQARAFSDSLPTPPAAPVTPAPGSSAPAGGAPAGVDRDRLAMGRDASLKESAELLARKPVVVVREAAPAPMARSIAAPRPASAPQVELDRLASVVANPSPAMASAPAKAEGAAASAPVPGRNLSRAENSTERKFSMEVKKSVAEVGFAGAAAPLGKALEPQAASSVAGVPVTLADNKLSELAKGQLADALLRPATPPAASPRGAGAAPTGAVALSLSHASSATVPTVQKRFQQLDERSSYRQNFNSPPLPQIMQDFAFERIGDRVRIVDGDGSTYEGTVLPETVEAARRKAAADDGREFKARATAPAQDETQAGTYRFVASGLNRKLNQSVEFRGQWQPATTPAAEAPALLAARSEATQLEVRTAMKKEKAVVGTIAAPAGPATNAPASGLSQGWISGRAVVGGKNEFDIRAVPR